MPRRPKFRPPYRVDVWEERDNVQITLYDGADREVATWTDDDARQMFEDGFFSHRHRDGLRGSVIAYAQEIGMIPPAKNPPRSQRPVVGTAKRYARGARAMRAKRNARGRVPGRRLKNSQQSDRKPTRSFVVSGVKVEWFQGYAEYVYYLREADGKPYKHKVETDAAELYLCSHPEFGNCLLIVDPSGRTPLWK
jgi:hypothetical protein